MIQDTNHGIANNLLQVLGFRMKWWTFSFLKTSRYRRHRGEVYRDKSDDNIYMISSSRVTQVVIRDCISLSLLQDMLIEENNQLQAGGIQVELLLQSFYKQDVLEWVIPPTQQYPAGAYSFSSLKNSMLFTGRLNYLFLMLWQLLKLLRQKKCM